jgi:hypothetical protein
MNPTLSIVVMGPPGSGKSWLASTSPGPRLVIDAEGGSRFTRVPKITWNPQTEPVPTDLTENTSVLVNVTDWSIAETLYRYLLEGNHPFKSIIIDTITELQSRLIDNISGTKQMQLQNWGQVRRTTEDYVRKLRDLTIHPTKPVDAVILIAQENTVDGKKTPMLSGATARTLPQFVDVIGYLFTNDGVNRGLMVSAIGTHACKDRTNVFIERYSGDDGIAVIPNPNIRGMLEDLSNSDVFN